MKTPVFSFILSVCSGCSRGFWALQWKVETTSGEMQPATQSHKQSDRLVKRMVVQDAAVAWCIWHYRAASKLHKQVRRDTLQTCRVWRKPLWKTWDENGLVPARLSHWVHSWSWKQDPRTHSFQNFWHYRRVLIRTKGIYLVVLEL